MGTPGRDLVFVSYSHADRVWLDRLHVFLKPYLRRGTLEVWSDPWIHVGDRWRRRIAGAIERARVAVFLTSPDFLASDFIVENEVPPLIHAVEAGEATLACVPISACAYDVPLPVRGRDVLLTEFQWCRPPAAPLDVLTEADRNQALVEIAGKLAEAAGGGEGWRPLPLAVHTGSATLPRPAGDGDGRPGALHGVPALPRNYVERSEVLDGLRDALLSSTGRSIGITGAPVRVGLHGQAGIGKTVMAQALVRDEEVRSGFPDGIVWLTVGQDPDRARLLGQVARAVHPEGTWSGDPDEVGAELSRILADRAILLVLDDVWDAGDARALDVTGERSRVLVVTRDATVISALEAVERRVDVLGEDAALELLGRWVGVPARDLPDAALGVARETGGLPLALSLAGAVVRDGVAWRDLAEALRAGRIEFLDHPFGSVFNSMRLSVEALPRFDAERYQELSVFPEDVAVPESTVRRLWARTGRLEGFEAGRLLGVLQAKNLVGLEDGEGDEKVVTLHDLQRDYLRLGVKDPAVLHRGLLEAHESLLPTDRVFPRPAWHALPPEAPYLWRHLAAHLIGADRSEVLRALLLDPRWLEAKLRATDLPTLLGDFDHLSDEDALRRVREALRLAGHTLTRDPAQLTGQLLGRLGSDGSEAPPLSPARPLSPGPWLRPRRASLTSPGGPEIATLAGHAGWVMAVAVTDDGRRAVSGSEDRTLKVWDLERGEEIATLTGHDAHVGTVALTRDGRRMVSGSDDCTLRLWDVDQGDEVATMTGHRKPVTGVAVTADGRLAVSGSLDATVRVWDLERGREAATLTGHEGPVVGVAVWADGKRAVSGSRDGTLRVWDLERGVEVARWGGSDIAAMAVTGDGQRAVTGSWEGTLSVWDVERGEALASFAAHGGQVESVAVTADGWRAVTGSVDRTLKVWDLERGTPVSTLKGHQGRVRTVAVTPDGRRAVTGSWDGMLKMWDLERGGEIATRADHEEMVNGVAVAADGRRAVSVSWDRTLKVWGSRGEEVATLTGHESEVEAVAMTADGTRAVSGSWDRTLKLWDVEGGEEIATLTGHRSSVAAVAVTPDGRLAVSGSDGVIKVWDLERREDLATLTGQEGWVRTLAVAPDGRRAVSGGRDGTLRFWDLEQRVEIAVMKGHADAVAAVAMMADGRRAVSGSWDRTVKVWDLERTEVVTTLSGHESEVEAVAVTGDGRLAVSGSSDRTLRVWDLKRGEAVATFTCDGTVRAVAVADRGEAIVAGDAIGRVHVLALERHGPDSGA